MWGNARCVHNVMRVGRRGTVGGTHLSVSATMAVAESSIPSSACAGDVTALMPGAGSSHWVCQHRIRRGICGVGLRVEWIGVHMRGRVEGWYTRGGTHAHDLAEALCDNATNFVPLVALAELPPSLVSRDWTSMSESV